MLMILKWSMIFYFMFMGLISFIFSYKHLLSMLLSLEFIVLLLFLFIMDYLSFLNYEMYFSMLFLTFSVCEGALGISIMVSMIRSHGNDNFSTYCILQC